MTAILAAQSGLTVEERLDIQELFANYCWSLNTGDADGYVECFARDGWLEHFPPKRYTGREEIRAMLPNLWYGRPHAFMGRQHHPHNFLMERADGELVLAKVQASVTRLDQTNNTYSVFLLVHWDVTCAKEDGRWRFKTMRITHWFRHEAPWVGDPKARLVLPGDDTKPKGQF